MNDDRDIRRSRFHVLVLGLACLAMAGLHVWRGHWLDALSNALWGLICFFNHRVLGAQQKSRDALRLLDAMLNRRREEEHFE